jgi:hypothetical protein
MSITTGGVPSPSLHVEDSSASAAAPAAVPATPSAAYSPGLQNALTSSQDSGYDSLLAATLAATLKRLDESLAAVAWPQATRAAGETSGNAATASRAAAETSATSSSASSNVSPGASSNASSGTASAASSEASAKASAADAASGFGGLDLQAPVTLAPGSYTLDYMARAAAQGGSAAARVVVHVYSGDTWRDLLARLARALGSASPSMLARLVPVTAGGIAPPKAANRNVGDGGFGGAAAADGTGATGSAGAGTSIGEGEAAGLAEALGGVLAASNDVGALLAKHADAFGPGAASAWNALSRSRARALDAVGVRRAGGALWLDEPAFLAALYADPAGTRAALAGPDGLLPALKDGAQAVAALADGPRADAPDTLAAGLLAAPAGRFTEAEVEKGGHVLDVYDADTDFSQMGPRVEGAGGLVRRKG